MLDQIIPLIESLGVDSSGVTQNAIIGEKGLGLDSQEIVELTYMVGKKFNIKLSDQALSKESTIKNLIRAIHDAQARSAKDSFFEGKCQASLDINCSLSSAYDAIYQMEEWPLKLPHVSRIDVLYNDGMYQEFFMDVISETGLIKVRSIRRCIKNESILFFQPTPPSFLKHHCGGWKFQISDKGCLVTTWHQWNVDTEEASQRFPNRNEVSTKDQIQRTLLDHAELALNTWKKNLEG